jgi:hypothetical protein
MISDSLLLISRIRLFVANEAVNSKRSALSISFSSAKLSRATLIARASFSETLWRRLNKTRSMPTRSVSITLKVPFGRVARCHLRSSLMISRILRPTPAFTVRLDLFFYSFFLPSAFFSAALLAGWELVAQFVYVFCVFLYGDGKFFRLHGF